MYIQVHYEQYNCAEKFQKKISPKKDEKLKFFFDLAVPCMFRIRPWIGEISQNTSIVYTRLFGTQEYTNDQVYLTQKSGSKMRMASRKTRVPKESKSGVFDTIHFPQFLPINRQNLPCCSTFKCKLNIDKKRLLKISGQMFSMNLFTPKRGFAL